MLAVIVRAAVVNAPYGFLIALVVERFLTVVIGIMQEAPASPDKQRFIDAAGLVESNFLLLVLIGTLVVVLARAHVESGGSFS